MIDRDFAVVIMAAGKGTRMNNAAVAKVMFPAAGVPMIRHVVERALECSPERVIVIVGHNRESVVEYLSGEFGDRVEFAEQIEQLGTGHAVMQAAPRLADFDGDVLVLSGDVPLLSYRTIGRLWDTHAAHHAVATVLTVIADDPTGYGRVIRNEDGSVSRIVEQKDASPEEREVREVNSGIYLFKSHELIEALGRLKNDNVQREYYLTDVFGWFREHDLPIAAYASPDFAEVQGINTVEQLAEVDQEFARRAVGRESAG